MQSIRSGGPSVQGEYILTPIQEGNFGKNQMSEMKQVSPSINGISSQQEQPKVEPNATKNLTQEDKASVGPTVADQNHLDMFSSALTLKPSNEKTEVYDYQNEKQLEKALENIPSGTNTGIREPSNLGTTITKEITTGQHPHLDKATNDAVQAYFNPEPQEINRKDSTKLVTTFNDQFTDKNDNIDFKAVIKKYNQDPETNPKLNPKAFKKAGIKGKVFVKEDGSFDFKISGKCSNEAVECMTALKKVLEDIKTSQTPSLDVPININPEAVGPLSHDDQAALANGGQIQYRLLPNGETMKLTLDPGSNGEGDGLTIGVYKQGQYSGSQSIKIPLKVVFEGGEFNGNPGVKPLLPNWRDQRLFEGSVIQEKTNLLGKVQETNVDDKGRIQIQNKLWNAVNEYLKISVEVTGGHFDMGNSKTLENQNPEQGATNVSEKTGNENQVTNEKESIEQKESNVPEKNKQQIQTNNDSLESNIQVDIDEKVSTQSNGNEFNISKNNLDTIKGIKGKLEELDSKDAESILTVLEDALTNLDKLLQEDGKSPEELKNAKRMVAQAKTTLKNKGDFREKFLDAAKKLSGELDKLIQGISVQDNDIDLGPIYDLCSSINADFGIIVERYNLEIKKLEAEYSIKKQAEGFDLLAKLSSLGIQNSQIKEKTEQLHLNVENDSDINRLFNLLNKYNEQQTQHSIPQQDYLKSFANWIKTNK